MKNNHVALLTQLIAVGGAFLSPNVFFSVAFLIVCGLAAFGYEQEETST